MISKLLVLTLQFSPKSRMRVIDKIQIQYLYLRDHNKLLSSIFIKHIK